MEEVAQNNVNTAAEDKVFNFRPVAFCGVCLCLGIFFAYFVVVYQFSFWLLAIGASILGGSIFFLRKHSNFSIIVKRTALLTLAFLVGMGSFLLQIHNFSQAEYYDGEYVSVSGKVASCRETSGGAELIINQIYADGKALKGKLIAYLPSAFLEIIDDGNEVLLTGKLYTDNKLTDENGLRAYAIADDIRYRFSADGCQIIDAPFSLFPWLRTRIKDAVRAGMDEVSASVTLGVLLSDTSFMDDGLLQNMRYGGIAHVFAVSGLHVGALFVFVGLLIQKTRLRKLSKLSRVLFLVAALTLYGGVCGFSPSIVRAIVMCLCVYVARIVGFGKDALETLGAAAIVVLLLSPVDLFLVGFMLSFGACYGMAMLTRPIARMLNFALDHLQAKAQGCKVETIVYERLHHPPQIWERIKNACVSYVSASTAAQIATAPICLWAFGYLSGAATLLNWLFVPLVTATFSALLLLVLIASLLPVGLSSILLYLPMLIWSGLLLVFQTLDFSKLCITSLKVEYGSMISYYLGIAFCSDKFNLKPCVKRIFACVCFTAFAITVYALSL